MSDRRSLAERILALAIDPDLRAVLVELAKMVERISEVDAMIARARFGVRLPPPPRDRHGMSLVRGGKR